MFPDDVPADVHDRLAGFEVECVDADALASWSFICNTTHQAMATSLVLRYPINVKALQLTFCSQLTSPTLLPYRLTAYHFHLFHMLERDRPHATFSLG
jgi:hypothetical protein